MSGSLQGFKALREKARASILERYMQGGVSKTGSAGIGQVVLIHIKYHNECRK
ncbi:MAG: hypothetical protein KDE66_07160 [Nitrosomonas sp.]|nr:hypothetical protein [Nitrosomonas sp.]MCP5292538.1 hypothetical protein [Burkholderiales bacterium]